VLLESHRGRESFKSVMHAVILLKCGRGCNSGRGVDFCAEVFLLMLGLIFFVEEGVEAFGLG
jgi:hypothetical protein